MLVPNWPAIEAAIAADPDLSVRELLSPDVGKRDYRAGVRLRASLGEDAATCV